MAELREEQPDTPALAISRGTILVFGGCGGHWLLEDLLSLATPLTQTPRTNAGVVQAMNIGSEKFKLRDQVVQVSFPDTGNARYHIRNILTGKDYPRVDATYEPECIFDIGANVGAAALFFASVYGSTSIY
jgi:hypothetical protein